MSVTSHWSRNRAALSRHAPELASRLDEVAPALAAGSSRETKPLQAAAPRGPHDCTVLLGARATHELGPLLDAGAGHVLLYEPDAAVLKHTLESVDLAEHLGHELHVATVLPEARAWLRRVFRPPGGIEVLCSADARRRLAGDLDPLLASMRREGEGLTADFHTRSERGPVWIEHGLQTLSLWTEAPRLDALRGCLRGRDAVVVGAGPSLDAALPALEEAQGRVAILCVDMALAALHGAGITPDLVFSVESNAVNRHLLGGALDARTPLCVAPSSHPDVLRQAPRLLLAPVGCDALAVELAQLLGATVWPAAFSVSTLAFAAARAMQAERITLVGQDLAFRDGRTYAAGSVQGGVRYRCDGEGSPLRLVVEGEMPCTSREVHDANAQEVLRAEGIPQQSVWVEGVEGDRLPTRPGFRLCIDWFVRQAELHDGPLFYTGRGARLRGFTHAEPSDALASRGSGPTPAERINAAIDAAPAQAGADALHSWQRARHAEAVTLQRELSAAARRAVPPYADLDALRALATARGCLEDCMARTRLWPSLFQGPLYELEVAQRRGPEAVLDATAQLFRDGAISAAQLSARLRPEPYVPSGGESCTI